MSEGVYLPPQRWTWRDVKVILATFALFFGPWLVIAAVVVGILFAVGVLP